MDYKLSSDYLLDPVKVKILQLQKKIQNLDIARDKGIHPAHISRHINGKGRNPKIQQAIADYLGVDLMDIVQEPETDQPEQPAA